MLVNFRSSGHGRAWYRLPGIYCLFIEKCTKKGPRCQCDRQKAPYGPAKSRKAPSSPNSNQFSSIQLREYPAAEAAPSPERNLPSGKITAWGSSDEIGETTVRDLFLAEDDLFRVSLGAESGTFHGSPGVLEQLHRQRQACGRPLDILYHNKKIAAEGSSPSAAKETIIPGPSCARCSVRRRRHRTGPASFPSYRHPQRRASHSSGGPFRSGRRRTCSPWRSWRRPLR